MNIAHMICGFTGAGKTTYAMGLAAERNAVRFTVDEWMQTLFWKDSPDTGTYQWALERVIRAENQMLKMSRQLVALGQEVIFDLGFFTFEQRERIRSELVEQGFVVQFHYLPMPVEARWDRVSRRNNEKGDTFALEVTRSMFDFCEELFEPLTASELQNARVVE